MSSPKSPHFPARLRAAREHRQLSQSQLAEASGFQPSAISHFEAGRRAPSFENLKRLSDALNVTTDYLLGRIDDPTSRGPTVDKLYRNLGELSQEDMDRLKDYVEHLIERQRKKPSGKPR